MTRLRILVIALAGLLVLTPSIAWGLWSSRAELDAVPVSAGTVAAPTDVSCSRVSGGLLQSAAEIRWSAPATQDDMSFHVLIDDGDTVYSLDVAQGEDRIVLDRGLLENLIVGLLELLLGGATATVTVAAVHDSGWTAESSSSVTITGNLLGTYCA